MASGISIGFDGCTGLTTITPNQMMLNQSYDSSSNLLSRYFYAAYHSSNITTVIIPDNITSISSYAFYGCSNLTIYCECTSIPSGWNSSWNNSNRPYYLKAEDCIHNATGNRWTYNGSGEIVTTDDIEWIIDSHPTVDTDGKKHATCPACGQYIEETVKYSIVTITNDTTYPWTVTDNSAVSTNHNDSSSSTLTLTVVGSGTLKIKYKTSSESNWDKLTIEHNSTQIVNGVSGEQSSYTEITQTVSTGDVIVFRYTKDSSQSSGSDCAYVEWEFSA